MSKQKLIDAEYWKSISSWRHDDIPLLFLGLDPGQRNVINKLSDQDKELCRKYYDLIDDAAKCTGNILSKNDFRQPMKFNAIDIITWRKSVSFIKPKKEFLKLEKQITNQGNNSENNKQQSTSNDENKCKQWLEGLMCDNSSQDKRKKLYQDEAKQNYNVGTKAFNRAWANAITATGNTNWGRPGRKKSKS